MTKNNLIGAGNEAYQQIMLNISWYFNGNYFAVIHGKLLTFQEFCLFLHPSIFLLDRDVPKSQAGTQHLSTLKKLCQHCKELPEDLENIK